METIQNMSIHFAKKHHFGGEEITLSIGVYLNIGLNIIKTLKNVFKKTLKFILMLTLPSLIIFTLTSFYKEEVQNVSASFQAQVCSKVIGNKMDHIFKENKDKMIELYCDCLSHALAQKQTHVISDLGLEDLKAPNQIINKVKSLTDQKELQEMANQCLKEISNTSNI